MRRVGSGSPIARPFALPHKQFVHAAVSDRAKAYLGNETTYEEATRHEGLPIMYDDRAPARGKVSVGLAPSTVWRWISWLSTLKNTLCAAAAAICQQEPQSVLHREVWAVSGTKYRSEARRHVLEQAVRWIVTGSVFERLFGRKIFPDFAMAHGWS